MNGVKTLNKTNRIPRRFGSSWDVGSSGCMCGWSGLSHRFPGFPIAVQLMLFLLLVHGIVVLCNEVVHLVSTGHPLHACPIVTMYCASEESSGYWKRLDSKGEVLAWAPR